MPQIKQSRGLRACLLAASVSMLVAACKGGEDAPAQPSAGQPEHSDSSSPDTSGGESSSSSPPASVDPQRPTVGPDTPAAQGTSFSYCDASGAIAAYPHFNGQVPEVVAHMHPSGGRDYPIIDAHTHLSTSASQEAELQRRVGLYSAVDAYWDAAGTAQQRGLYKKPYIIQFNLGQYLKGIDSQKLPSVQTELDGQVMAGAGGIKIFKDLGLTYNDGSGARLRVDDTRLYPLWQRAADEKWAVSIHVADPNSWMARYYANNPYSKQDLIRQFIRVVEENPRTVFVAIHLLNLIDSDAELDQLGGYLERYPNLYADTSARSQYLVHLDQAHVRDFMIKHQDKLLFATDRAGENAPQNYEEELRYWETTGPTRTFYLNSKANGLGLPPEVLEKFYYKNALRVFCAQLPAAP